VLAVRDHLDLLTGASVAVVTFSAPDRLEAYRRGFGLPFPVLADPDRRVYRAYGFDRGDPWRVWGPATLARYARLLARGRRLARPTEDLLQLGGDVIVDRRGRVAYLHRGRSPAERPTVAELAEALARA